MATHSYSGILEIIFTPLTHTSYPDPSVNVRSTYKPHSYSNHFYHLHNYHSCFSCHPLSPGLICSTTSFPISTLVPDSVYSKHGSQSGPVKNRNQIPFLRSNSPMTSHSKIKSLKWPVTSCFPPHLMLWWSHCSLNTQVFFYLRTYVFIVPSVWNDYIQISSRLILWHSFDLYPITLSKSLPWTSHPKLQPTPP